jgi:hypothetical protein
VDEANLVGIHEARIAHHVATVREIHRQNGAAAPLHGRRAVVVQLLIVVRAHVAAGKHGFDVPEHLRINRHYVFEVAMLGAVLHHQDLAVALDDLSFDLTDFFVQKDFVRKFAVENLLADLGDAARAK